MCLTDGIPDGLVRGTTCSTIWLDTGPSSPMSRCVTVFAGICVSVGGAMEANRSGPSR
jgi:hypothetical protein